ncbi:MAG TPA: ferritin-like domain-containing protein [Terriglobales bacterium]|nr:ferritin-like domain-containing protein [Terriglobales bacterium]
MPHFVEDVEQIRQRAIHKLEDGPVTEAYGVDKNRTIDILNEALATEIVCVLRYLHHYFMATGVHGKSVADEFKEHADAEREHADLLAERISQLGGKPDFNPRNLLERSVSQYVEGETLGDMIREDLIAERVVIEVYTEMIRFFGNNDPTTRVMLEKLLADEEEHANDLTDLLYIVDPKTGEDVGQDPGTEPLKMHSGHRDREEGRQRSERRRNGDAQGFGQRGDDLTGSLHPEDTELGRAAAVSTHERQQQERSQRGERGNRKNEDRGNRQQKEDRLNPRAAQSRQPQPLMRNAERRSPPSGEHAGEGGSGQKKPNRNLLPTSGERPEFRPARATGEERPESNRGRGAATAPAHTPGGRGRPMNRRQQEMDTNINTRDVAERANEGAQGGSTRAVRVTRPNRKKRVA